MSLCLQCGTKICICSSAIQPPNAIDPRWPRAMPPTAYERDQQALRDRVTGLENELKTVWASLKRKGDRLDRAEERIEQLELEVATLKGPREPVPEPPAIYLPCGCWNDVHGCRGHNASPATAERAATIARKEAFGAARAGATLPAEGDAGIWRPNMLTVTKVDVENGRVELRASPATAYPPVPDEPTV